MNYFEQELNYIKDEESRQWTKEILDHVNEKFYIEAASTTGKYHPEYALGEGGLYRHTKAAVMIAQCLRENKFAHSLTDMEYDLVIAALILHDTCKCGRNWQSLYTLHRHPIEAKDLIREALTDVECGSKKEEFVMRVSSMVASHMGQWTTSRWEYTVLPEPANEAERLVHICDYLASRKFIEINFDKGI